MARANLHVKQEVIDEFLNAQEARNVRIIKVRIVGEEMLLDGSFLRQGSCREDFDGLLKGSLNETEAAFLLFCATDDENGPLSWILVAWVPDGCRVRDKMLYSSSREDLKYRLGLGYFKSEYSTNCLSDINWETYEKSLKLDFDPSILTEVERLVLEEKVIISFCLSVECPPFFLLLW
jgi:twinfilin-like protein